MDMALANSATATLSSTNGYFSSPSLPPFAPSSLLRLSHNLSSSSFQLYCSSHSLLRFSPATRSTTKGPKSKVWRVRCSGGGEPLKVMISGAPASGKGTQCEMIVQKFGLVHISTGDLLRAEVSSGTEIGIKAKEYMNAGQLVPDDIVTAMVTSRLSREDAKVKGWLLDGYPRSLPQAQSLERLNIRPDICIVLHMHWKKAGPYDRKNLSSSELPSRDRGYQSKTYNSS